MATIASRGLAFSLVASAISITGTGFVQAAEPQNPPRAVVPLTNVFSTVQGVEPRVSASSGNMLQFGTSEALREKGERLKDPQQRAEVRVEERARLADSYRDLREVLELDDATAEKVLELLTHQQMDRLDQMFLRSETGSTPGHQWADLTQAQADIQTKYIQALRAVLGQEKLERYQTFEKTLGERARVAQLDARLAPAHKLQPDQRERMIELFQDDTARYVAEMRFDWQPFAHFRGRQMTSLEDMQRQSQLSTIAMSEQNWRRLPGARSALRQRAAAILTPAQLATLKQMHEEEISGQQEWIQRMRVEAGLSEQIPAEPEASEVAKAPNRTPIAGEVKFRIQLTVNRNAPDKFSHVGGNGESVTFECADGLLMEVTPILYDDDMYNLDVTYYEQGSNGKRRIGQGGSMGMLDKNLPAAGLEFSGSSTTILTGNKGYAVELKARIDPA